MKRVYFSLLWLTCFGALASNYSRAQSASQYIFTPSKGSFSCLSAGLPVSGATPIGFNFSFAGTNYSYVRADYSSGCNGWISFDTTVFTSPANSAAALADISPAIFPLWCQNNYLSQLQYSNNPPIGKRSYLTTGTAPYRVFTLEYRNYGWFNDSSNISFQLKLYETTNEIQFIYKGEHAPEFGNTAAPVGSVGIATGTNDFLSLSSFVSVPYASSTSFTTMPGCMPATGQIYTFTPPAACTGSPVPGSIAVPADPWSLCTGNFFTLIDTGYSKSNNLSFQWQSSVNGGVLWSSISGATESYYTYVALSNTQYRLKLTCLATLDSSFTAPVSVLAGASPEYVSVPYFQDFEEWMNNCAILDVPGPEWSNSPPANDSWRRNDQGYFNNWGTAPASYLDYGVPNRISGDHSAVFPGGLSNLDLHLDCSSQNGSKGVSFYYLNYGSIATTGNGYVLTAGNDSLIVSLSTNGGNSFTRLNAYTNDTAFWEKKHLDIPSNSSSTVLRFQGLTLGPHPGHIAIDSLYIVPPCSGPVAGGSVAEGAVLSGCPGAPFKLTSIGASMGGDIHYQWEYSDNAGTSWTAIPSDTNLVLKISGLYDTTLFRFRSVCGSTGSIAYSTVTTINVQTPLGSYAPLPFVENFETWTNQCDMADVPGIGGITHSCTSPSVVMLNTPSPSNSSMKFFRRDDFWGDSNPFHPGAVKGAYCARFSGSPSAGFYPSDELAAIKPATMDFLADCSVPGTKELQFYYNNPGGAGVGNGGAYLTPPLKVYLSDNGGISFSMIGSWSSSNQWELKSIPVQSTSAKTVIRFSFETLTGSNGAGVDYVKLVLACSGQPTAGTVDSAATHICPNHEFYLGLTGATQAQGLLYQWQRSLNGSSWNSIPGATTESYLYSISSDTWFRCIVSCVASALSDTTPPRHFQIAPFYYCYCDASPLLLSWAAFNIGHVALKDSTTATAILATGDSATFVSSNFSDFHRYSDFREMPVSVYRDSVYKIGLGVLNWPGNLGVDSNQTAIDVRGFIDFNRDGVFDPVTEIVFDQRLNQYSPIDSSYFQVPINANLGLTGLRFISTHDEQGTLTPDPCAYDDFLGEVEDYLVRIDYAPCNGPLSPGITSISDTLVPSGASVLATNTSHDSPDSIQLSQAYWSWQFSIDGINWSVIPASAMIDSLNQSITANTWFRLMMVCQHSHDTTYSNIVYVNLGNTSISAASASSALQFFPNPTSGRLSLKYTGATCKQFSVTVSDIAGKPIFHKVYAYITSGFITDFDLANYSKGVYLIRTHIDDREFDNRIILK